MAGSRDALDDTALQKEESEAASPEGDRLQLVVNVEERFESFRLPSHGDVSIGRGSSCVVRIDHPSISRAHAVLTIGRGLHLRDSGSANGTKVAGHRIVPGEAVGVSVGDAITIGAAMIVIQRVAAARAPRRMLSHDYFEARVEEECARRARTGGSFAVVRLQIVTPVAEARANELVARPLRAHDVLAAYAPREYELLLDADRQGASEVATRIVSELAGADLDARTGIATYPADGATAGALVASANDAVRHRARDAIVGVDAASIASADPSPMNGLRELVARVAASTISVLILGETGVGKEVLAETVHRLSPRRDRTFLRLNCAALEGTLLESELFGHERGAFTGAVAQKRGLLETADGGTVFLDEVGDLPTSTQVKLLRVIEDRKVTRVGGLNARALDVRFVAATNRDLEGEVARGAFRQDLFFRLNGVSIVIPPLRERLREIEELARAFVAESARDRPAPPRIAPEAMSLLLAYSWPGNIRELRNVMERAVLLSGDDDITPRSLPIDRLTAPVATRALPRPSVPSFHDVSVAAPTAPPSSRRMPSAPPDGDFKTETYPTLNPDSSGAMSAHPISTAAMRAASSGGALRPLKSELEALERQRILDALERCVWNQTKAAQLLGVSRGVLIARLEQYGIARPRKRTGG